MGFHLYCVTPHDHEPASAARGIAGARVRSVGAGTLAVWASEHPTQPPPDLDAVRAHADVACAALTQDVTPVPVRFGQWLPDEMAVIDRVSADADRWHALLDSFAGAAEYGITVADSGAAGGGAAARDVHPAQPSGSAYMQALAARHAADTARRAEAGRLAAEIDRRTAQIYRDQRVETAQERILVRVAHLVAWDDRAVYDSVMQELRASLGGLRVLCSGPWPPYSFVT